MLCSLRGQKILMPSNPSRPSRQFQIITEIYFKPNETTISQKQSVHPSIYFSILSVSHPTIHIQIHVYLSHPQKHTTYNNNDQNRIITHLVILFISIHRWWFWLLVFIFSTLGLATLSLHSYYLPSDTLCLSHIKLNAMN